jgi:hypothetical protein
MNGMCRVESDVVGQPAGTADDSAKIEGVGHVKGAAGQVPEVEEGLGESGKVPHEAEGGDEG